MKTRARAWMCPCQSRGPFFSAPCTILLGKNRRPLPSYNSSRRALDMSSLSPRLDIPRPIAKDSLGWTGARQNVKQKKPCPLDRLRFVVDHGRGGSALEVSSRGQRIVKRPHDIEASRLPAVWHFKPEGSTYWNLAPKPCRKIKKFWSLNETPHYLVE